MDRPKVSLVAAHRCEEKKNLWYRRQLLICEKLTIFYFWVVLQGTFPTHDCVHDWLTDWLTYWLTDWLTGHSWWAAVSEQSVFGSLRSSSDLLTACVHASQSRHCSCFIQRERSGEAGVWGSSFLNGSLLLFTLLMSCVGQRKADF